MPTIYRYKSYRFFFFSNEGIPLERPHVHVRHGERIAKFWLTPHVVLADAWHMSAAEVNELRRIVQEQRKTFERAWYEFFRERPQGPAGLVR